MTDHDPLDDLDDPQLADALGALAPPSETDAYPAAHRHFVQRRQRRRIATAGAGIVTAAAAVALVVAVSGGPSSISGVRTVDPAGSSRTPGTSSPSVTSSTTGGTNATTTSTTGATVVPGPVTSTPTSGSTAGTTGPASTHEETVTSPGGTVRVRIGAGTVVLLSNTPAAGYSPDVRATGPTEVEVRFRMGSSGKDEHRIRLRFDSSGSLQREIE